MPKRLYIAYTGGTIGMSRTPDGYAPAPGFLAAQMAAMPELADPRMPGYDIHEYDPLLDSSNMRPADWVRIGQDIVAHYDAYDGFLVLHGTDTMAYTASALPFFLQGLRKPVIVTGSQIPLCEIRNDARANLITSMLIAAEYPLPEVCLYFGGKLLRGCRSVKVDADGLEAFDSPKYPPLGVAGVEIQIDPTCGDSRFMPHQDAAVGPWRGAGGRVARRAPRRGHGGCISAVSGSGARSAAERAPATAPGVGARGVWRGQRPRSGCRAAGGDGRGDLARRGHRRHHPVLTGCGAFGRVRGRVGVGEGGRDQRPRHDRRGGAVQAVLSVQPGPRAGDGGRRGWRKISAAS